MKKSVFLFVYILYCLYDCFEISKSAWILEYQYNNSRPLIAIITMDVLCLLMSIIPQFWILVFKSKLAPWLFGIDVLRSLLNIIMFFSLLIQGFTDWFSIMGAIVNIVFAILLLFYFIFTVQYNASDPMYDYFDIQGTKEEKDELLV